MPACVCELSNLRELLQSMTIQLRTRGWPIWRASQPRNHLDAQYEDHDAGLEHLKTMPSLEYVNLAEHEGFRRGRSSPRGGGRTCGSMGSAASPRRRNKRVARLSPRGRKRLFRAGVEHDTASRADRQRWPTGGRAMAADRAIPPPLFSSPLFPPPLFRRVAGYALDAFARSTRSPARDLASALGVSPMLHRLWLALALLLGITTSFALADDHAARSPPRLRPVPPAAAESAARGLRGPVQRPRLTGARRQDREPQEASGNVAGRSGQDTTPPPSKTSTSTGRSRTASWSTTAPACT